MNLKRKMIISITIPVLLVVILLSFISYKYSSQVIIKESQESILNEVKKYGSDVETIISEKQAYVEILTNTIQRNNLNDEELLLDLKYLSKNVKGSLGFFIGLNNKKFLDGTGWVPDKDYDPTTRDWYKNAIEKNEIIISPPYINSMDNKTVITISKKIERNGQDIGVLGNDISMEELEKLIKDIKVKNTGQAYLLDEQGNFMIHQNYTSKDNIKTVDDKSMQSLSDKIFNQKNEVFENKTKGVDKIYAIYNVKGTNI